ncbi:MAG: dihydrolipoamide acetyltransferase family protein [Oscillospiraceae bacterium]
MANIIIMPKQGLQMTEGTLTQWLKKEGESVKEGEPLFEMETDKLTITIDSTAEGTLLKILHPVGDVVPITLPIAVVGAPGEDYSALLGDAPAAEKETPKAQKTASAESKATAVQPVSGGKIYASPRAKMRAEEKGFSISDVPGTGPEGLVIERDVIAFEPSAQKASPLAKKLAEQSGVDISGVSGTGSHGKVMADDVRAKAAPPAPAEAPSVPGELETVIPVKGMRKIIAQRMKESLLDMAQANHRMTVDMSEIVKLREQLKALSVKVSYNDFILRATAKALTEFPMVNASMAGDTIILKHYVNVGMAVATDNGLVVPVIKGADKMCLTEIAAKSADLASRTKSNQLQPDEMSGGTFTVTNLGMFEVDSFTAVINPPEAGILAVGRMQKQPVVLADDTIGVKPLMQLSLTYDHRIIDGAPAAKFLLRIKTLLENPGLLM